MSQTTSTPNTATHAEAVEAIAKLMKHFRVGMLTTRGTDGALKSRPLGTQEVEFDGDVWFATGFDSEKVREIEADPQVNVSFQDDGANRYVSIHGRARIVRDRAKIDALWSPAMKIFFPGGKDDPNLCLVQVQAEGGEYWDGPGSALGKLVYLATAAVTGNPGAMSEHATVDLGSGTPPR